MVIGNFVALIYYAAVFVVAVAAIACGVYIGLKMYYKK